MSLNSQSHRILRQKFQEANHLWWFAGLGLWSRRGFLTRGERENRQDKTGQKSGNRAYEILQNRLSKQDTVGKIPWKWKTGCAYRANAV